MRSGAVMHSGGQVHQPLRHRDEGGQDVRSQSVHGEKLRQAVDCLHQLRLSVADPGVMDDGVETAELVDLVGDGFRLRDARQVANDDVLRASDLLTGLVRARGAPGVQHDLVPLLDQKLGGHLSKAIGGAGDERRAPSRNPLAFATTDCRLSERKGSQNCGDK